MSDTIEKQLELKIHDLSNTSFSLQQKKEKVLEKLLVTIDKMSLDPETNSSKITDAKSAIINTFISLSSSIEKERRDTLKFESKHQLMNDIQDNISHVIVEMFQKFGTPEGQSVDTATKNVDTYVEDDIKNKNIKVSDDEILLDKEKKSSKKLIDKYKL